MKYGKVDVVAKIPQGDWLWPAIWMLPENTTYGAWPLSGEIDVSVFVVGCCFVETYVLSSDHGSPW